MAAPNSTEISNLKVWSLYCHYFHNRQMYVNQGRAIVAALRAMQQKAAQTKPATNTVPQDDIAASFMAFLMNDANWKAYLGNKHHMTGPVVAALTDSMARFIAWEAHGDMTK
jgi:isocitrate dehydrogenase kinase/phosphatase